MADGPRDRPSQEDMMTKPRHLNQEEEREGVLPQGPTGHSFRVLPGNFSHISSSKKMITVLLETAHLPECLFLSKCFYIYSLFLASHYWMCLG